MTSNENRSKFRTALTWVACAAMIAGVGWSASSCLGHDDPQPRGLTDSEAGRLAKVPVNNAASDPVAMSVTFDGANGGATGHVDWKHQLASVATTAEGTSQPEQLVQAVPGLTATHTADADSDPAAPPATGWTVRASSAGQESSDQDDDHQVLDITLSAVLSLVHDEAGNPATLKEKGSWLKEANIDGATVDVFQAPLDLGTAEKGQEGGEAIFWVDRDANLRRLQLDPANTGLTSIDFLLKKPSVDKLEPVGVLGGGTNDPRDLNEAEVNALSTLRQRNADAAAEVDMELPLGDDELIRARGYIDWRVPLVYLSLDAPGEDNDGLLLALPGGAATRQMSVDGSLPPVEAPDDDWSHQNWSQRTESDSESTSTLDAMLMKLLMLRSPEADDYQSIQDNGAWLRQDSLGDTKTNVVEFPFEHETEDHERGKAPYRYWIGEQDDLLRVEMNTQGFGLAHADLTKHEAPTLSLPQNVTATLLQ